MSKYCKTGVLESTLLRSGFVKASTCIMFDKNSFIDVACMLKLQVINPSYLIKLRGW